MKTSNKFKLIIVILSIIIFILLILLFFNNKLLSNNIIINNLLFIMQFLSYIATIIGITSIVFAYVQYKNIENESNNKISNETINMLNDFTTKVMPNIDAINHEYNILNNKNIDKTYIKGIALDNQNNKMNYIDLWCRRLLMFKNRDMIQEEVLYDEVCDSLIDFLNFYKEGLKYKDPYNKYYRAIYILYDRWTNMDFNNMNNV